MSKEKDKFRKTQLWITFRKHLIYERGSICSICGKVDKRINVHHLDEKNYEDLKDDKFILLCRRDHVLLEQLLRRKTFNIEEYTHNLKDAYNRSKQN